MEQLPPTLPVQPGLPPLPEDAAIRQAATDILRGPDYILTKPSHDTEALFFRIWESVKRFIQAFSQWTHDLYNLSPILYWLLMAGLITVLFLLLWHIATSLRRAFTRSDPATSFGLKEDTVEEPLLWERRATEAHARGDRVFALRCLLMAGLLRLEAGQKKRLRRGATNREILRRYRETDAFEPLKLMVDLVDIKWYGDVKCTAEDFDAGARAYDRLRSCAAANRPALTETPPMPPGLGGARA